MGAALSAAVRPVTRVPVTMTASVSCAKDGAAPRTSRDAPSRSKDLDLDCSDIEEPPRCSPLAKLVWFLPAHFSLADAFCAVRHVRVRLGPSPQRRKPDSRSGLVTEKWSGKNVS